MQAIAQARISGVKIAAIISNRPDSAGIEWARQQGLHTEILDHKQFSSREDFDQQLAKLIDSFTPDLVVLAGFMRILTPAFTTHYAGRMINIHPSLLPAFPGLQTHQRALDAGCHIAGCTVHFVTAELDHGPIISQGVVNILQDDTAATLAARVLELEHQLYPEAVRAFAQGQLELVDGKLGNKASLAQTMLCPGPLVSSSTEGNA